MRRKTKARQTQRAAKELLQQSKFAMQVALQAESAESRASSLEHAHSLARQAEELSNTAIAQLKGDA